MEDQEVNQAEVLEAEQEDEMAHYKDAVEQPAEEKPAEVSNEHSQGAESAIEE
jgi:hypothetical protein